MKTCQTSRASRATQVALLALVFFLALTFPGAGFAHEMQGMHHLILEVEAERSELLVLYELPTGKEATLLRTLYDRNRDGLLNDDERSALAAGLTPAAIAGLNIERDGQALPAESVEWRLETKGGTDSMLLVLLITFPGGVGRYAVSLQGQATRPLVTFEAEAGVGLHVAAAVAAPSPDKLAVGPLELGVGDELWVTFEADSAP